MDHLEGVFTKDQAFISRRFNNWKKATEKIPQHKASSCHRVAAEKLSANVDIAKKLPSIHKAETAKNRRMLLKILRSVKYLARQSIPIRADYESGEGEINNNLVQLLFLRSEDDPDLKYCLRGGKLKRYVTGHTERNFRTDGSRYFA